MKEVILTVVVKEEAEGGYSSICPELDVASQGETIEEAIANAKEAVELYLESAKELKVMDEVYEKLGVSKSEAQKTIIVPRVVTTTIPVKVTA
jgi:predicted RNase H-like HicB family nuclease